jgi:membrane protein implicated in regulation of membrane protease activity
MSETAWTIALCAVVVLALVAILLPWFRPARPWTEEQHSALDRLFEEKGRVLRALKDLDHEHGAGLLNDADWRAAREEHVAEAVRLNREIAAQSGADPATLGAPRTETQAQQRAESRS